MQIQPVNNTNFKGIIQYTPELKKMTEKVDSATLDRFNELVRNIEQRNDNMLYKFTTKNIYKMKTSAMRFITNFILTKHNLETNQEDFFIIEEIKDSATDNEPEEKRYSEIMNIFIRHFNDEVFSTQEKKVENNYKKIIENSILGDK